MSHSLRVKLGGLRYKNIISDKDYSRLCKALDNEDVLDKIRAEIKEMDSNITEHGWRLIRKHDALQIIDKYKAESENKK